MKDLKFIKKELDQQSERYVRAMKVIEKKRRKAEEIKDDNIKDITQKHEILKYLRGKSHPTRAKIPHRFISHRSKFEYTRRSEPHAKTQALVGCFHLS